ncbi:MAG: outer membrane beta-barrel protein [Nitrospira sp.]|nr:outer membrane beta-barrel protein [Nitrospira sp.]
MKKFLLVLVVMGLILSSGPVWAKDGLYLGMDIGVAVAPDMDVKTGGLDDWSTTGFDTKCDATINPERLQGGHCTNDPVAWAANESFDGGSGILAGLAVGYRLGGFRVEGEYFYRGTRYGSTDEPYFPDSDWRPSDSPEYGDDGAEDALDNLMSHNFFANLYYDYRSDSKFTPYAGFGIGFAQVSVQYRTRWQRSTNAEDINVFDRDMPGGELNERLAGVLTNDEATMSDTLFGYQALAGVDYQVSEPLTIGLKFRYAMFGEFEDESQYTRLRGHAPVVGNPPTRPATYYINTDDIQFWGVSLNMKYQF